MYSFPLIFHLCPPYNVSPPYIYELIITCALGYISHTHTSSPYSTFQKHEKFLLNHSKRMEEVIINVVYFQLQAKIWVNALTEFNKIAWQNDTTSGLPGKGFLTSFLLSFKPIIDGRNNSISSFLFFKYFPWRKKAIVP